MSKVNQLLAKAMSTTSEDEAVACLRMARKIGGEVSHKPEETGYKGHNAEYWHKKADEYYNFAKHYKSKCELAEDVERHVKHRLENSQAELAKLRKVVATADRAKHTLWMYSVSISAALFLAIGYISSL